MASIGFPLYVSPSTRRYSPGTFPQQTFESQNGAKTVLRYGSKRVNATLTLGFANIEDALAALILENYEAVNEAWDSVTFGSNNGLQGISNAKRGTDAYGDIRQEATNDLTDHIQEAISGLKWRYSGPPTVTSTFKGRSNVSCSFVACLDSP